MHQNLFNYNISTIYIFFLKLYIFIDNYNLSTYLQFPLHTYTFYVYIVIYYIYLGNMVNQSEIHHSTFDVIDTDQTKRHNPKRSKLSRYSKAVSVLFISLLAIASFIISIIALVRTNNNNSANNFSDGIKNLLQTYNSTAYAYSDSNCNSIITGQTSEPGRCIDTTQSIGMNVTRIAANCNIYVYDNSSCTGRNDSLILSDGYLPTCYLNPLSNTNNTGDGDKFNSFKILCN